MVNSNLVLILIICIILVYLIIIKTTLYESFIQVEDTNSYIGIELVGGLGNMLFQFATAYSLSKQYNKTLYLNTSHYLNPHSITKYEFIEKYKNDNIIPEIIISENDCDFSTYTFIPDHHNKNILLKGYYQNEKYFDNYNDDIKKILNIKYEGTEYTGNKKAFLHVRLGDFITTPMHNIHLDNYYKIAIKYMKNIYNDCTFYVFSNDINACKQNIIFQDIQNFIYVENLNELESIGLMSICEYGGICPNSTFSWWGAYLNSSPKKKIIFPNKWLNNDWKVYIYMKDSIILPL